MTRPRVLHLGKGYPPDRGGIETVVETLCRVERRWVETQALVISRGRSTVFEVLDDVPVRRVGSAVTVGAVSIAPTLPMWLARADADLLVLHEPNPMALLAYYLARPPMPLVVLTADKPYPAPTNPDLPADINTVTREAQDVSQRLVAQLAPGAEHITETDSGHDIMLENPVLVSDAILDVVAAVRDGRTSMS